MPWRMARQLSVAVLLAVAHGQTVLLADEKPAVDRRVDFDADVRPILAANCFKCHGPDLQESDLRLDRREAAVHGGSNGAPIVPGDSGKSPLIERVLSVDADLQMPPEGKRLTAEAIATLKAWIDAGANWPDDAGSEQLPAEVHWSLRPLVRPLVPAETGAASTNPIDAFLRAKLHISGLAPSPEADRPTLIRRVTFDLIGLSPTPDEVDAFCNDTSSNAYERLVDRLLASPRYGERWARHWMDVVHFAETHGNDQDRPRPNAWPYRDYLIRAFNDDKPYARFVKEQVAGDVLYADDSQVTPALGFLAAGPWDESSLMCIVDDTIDKKLAQMLDRDDMVTNCMSTFISTTVHCARCHNHKFDPISQAEYYRLQAVFAGVDRADRAYDPSPEVFHQRRALQKRRLQVGTVDGEQLLADAETAGEVARLEAEFRQNRGAWSTAAPSEVKVADGSTAAIQSDNSILFGGARPEKDSYSFTIESDLEPITAIQLELLNDPSLPQGGPGRHDNGNLHLSELKVSLESASGGAAAGQATTSAYADFNQPGWEISAAIDGNKETAWGIHPEVGKAHSGVFVLAEPITAPGRKRLTVVLEQLHGRGHLIGKLRLSLTAHPNPALARPVPASLEEILAIDPAGRTRQQQIELARVLLTWKVDAELSELPATQLVYAAASEFKGGNNFRPAGKPRPVHLLRRGDINQPLDEAKPGGLDCIAGLPAVFELATPDDEGPRRAALADWLVDPRNVLTWRSIVNRVWHYHFDRGIVDTPNDLGKMGAAPSNPELLDWLAVEFRDSGGSLKNLHRLVVTSATYRQSSQIDAARATVDADNRLLWRMNRRRLDAECIRDTVLQVSGKLDLTMGGPSVKQFVESPGIHVTPIVDYLSYDVDAPGNYRRSIYRFLFRTLPDPLMESLDCPDGSQLAPSRSASVTALQALSLLDNRFIVRQSEHAAARFASIAPELPEQIRLLFRSVLLREPTSDESRLWEEYARKHGLANACRMMFNTNEFVFVN